MNYSIRFSWLLLTGMFFLPAFAAAQTPFWSDIAEQNIQSQPKDRLIVPERYRTLRLQFESLKKQLLDAPPEQAILDGEPGLLLDFPLPDGGFVQMEVWESPVLAPALAAQFPQIRSFGARDAQRNGLLARFDVSPAGFHAMLLNTLQGSVFIDPYARGNTQDYLCYFRKDFVKRDGSQFVCDVNEPVVSIPGVKAEDRSAGDCGNLRQYSLALACTGEYANFHGAFGNDKAPALAAMNTSMNRVNGVFERDCGVRMIIIANNTAIIFTDPATDPYTNGNGSTMLNQNQTTCDNIIGSPNYDIGHVFSTGGGGVAFLQSVCSGTNKAKGVTGQPNPIGDPFDIDYVAHEMGHQYGGNHTQYNSCNRNNPTAVEPGSASTIMGYAGICDPNVQPHSDDYFHGINLSEMGNFITSGGNSCATLVANGNNAPSVNALTNRSIPRSTPFVLTGTASDPNGDGLTYCWEQTNAFSNPAQPMPPQPTNTSGPVFRSLLPQPSNSRYFPNFDDVLVNVTPTWEVVPSVARAMNFRLTVRDNHANGGCTAEGNMTVTTVNGTGPFQVTTPNGGESYTAGSTQTVVWNVAGSSGAPISTANVNILISVNGGASFTILLANTPNDGSQNVTYSVSPTTAARILVQAVGNIFYDVSNNNFTITSSLPVELLSFEAAPTDAGPVQLDWTTASEKNNRGFHIERAEGDASHFQTIGWVDGHGTTAFQQRYSFTDAGIQPARAYYYRLRQIDFSGEEKYSELRRVQTGDLRNALIVSPNPAREKLLLHWPERAEAAPGKINLLSAGGALVGTFTGSPGDELLVQNLTPGFYVVRVKSEDGKEFEARFLKL